MALTGQLSDMSLAELIEFFCNQRKTGRLKIDYQRGHSVFFIKEGELVDAKVGALSGAEAVYFSLTLPNAAFDFSPDVQATRRTIDQAWTQVVLEGLRRLDEGLSPTEADAFGAWSPNDSELAQMLDQVEHLDAIEQKQSREKRPAARAAAPSKSREESPREAAGESKEDSSPEPFSMMVESASGASGGSKKKFVIAGVAAAVVLACAVAAFPLLSRPAAKPAPEAAAAPAEAPAVAAPAEAAPADTPADANAAPAPEADATAAAEAARREERERRERERRERERREDAAAKKEDAALNAATDPAAAPKPVAPAGPKSVRVSVSYDEAGRVTQASVAGATPGAEAYGSTAVRIARGKRFPAGKAGSTVVTIPVN
ncbi:MAG TPA: DUF4388 domain-containing protein [Pyrinomonadaceae bacterium]|jgi:hypothetical protein